MSTKVMQSSDKKKGEKIRRTELITAMSIEGRKMLKSVMMTFYLFFVF